MELETITKIAKYDQVIDWLKDFMEENIEDLGSDDCYYLEMVIATIDDKARQLEQEE